VVEAIPAGVQKREVLEELGESTLLLPALVASGLEANDRAKYLLTLFQAAREHADSPSMRPPSMREERLAAGVTDDDLDSVVERSRRTAPNSYHVPNAGLIHARLIDAIDDMLRPLDAARLEDAPDHARLRALATEGPDATSEVVLGTYVDRMTSADRQRSTGCKPKSRRPASLAPPPTGSRWTTKVSSERSWRGCTRRLR
jgi:hypothetical protein